jgi:predicted flap endonuclease-1-like 5' DNA nuclease
MKISDVQGIGPAYAKKLAKAGIRTTESLLKKGASPEGRKEIEGMSGVGKRELLDWVNMADLYRIKGVGGQFSELLMKTGVDTVIELSKRQAKHLYAEMKEINQAKNLVNRMPTMDQVDDWIKQAKKLPRAISY